jgi:hypothetical protein
MTYDEFTRQIGKAGLSLREFAQLLMMNSNSLSNLAKKGEVPDHLAVIVSLMGEMAERRVDFRPVVMGLDLKPKKPRGAGVGRFGGDKDGPLV